MVMPPLAPLVHTQEATRPHLDHLLAEHQQRLNHLAERRLRILRLEHPHAHVEHQLPSVEMIHRDRALRKCMTRASRLHFHRKHLTAQEPLLDLRQHARVQQGLRAQISL